MNGVVYFAILDESVEKKRLCHMAGEKLLEIGLREEYGKELAYEPRAKGTHGKPFFTQAPDIHYNISHSGKYVLCAFASQPVGVDVQKHTEVKYKRALLERMVPAEMVREIREAPNPVKAFFTQWVLREAYIKWTGEGLSRDMRTIPMDDGHYMLLDLEEGYSAALWCRRPMEIRMEYVHISPEDLAVPAGAGEQV